MRTNLQRPLTRRLLPLVYGLAAVVALILFLTWGALQVQVTLAGFLNGESVWSKSQKQAVISLDSYAAGGKASHLDDFHRNLVILKSDRRAREAIASGHFKYARVRRDFQKGQVIPAAIPGMIFMLEHFSSAPYMRQALQAWRSTDASIDQLARIADELQAARAHGALTQQVMLRQQAHIHALNRNIEPRSDQFSLQMARGASWLGRMLFTGVLATAVLAVLLWLWMARRVMAGIRGSEERYRLLFDSAADAIIMVAEDSGRILQANRTASAWTGCSEAELTGQPLTELFEPGEEQAGTQSPRTCVLKHVEGRSRPVEMHSSLAHWGKRPVRQAILRDISERVSMEHERRIAAEALASVAEGVIIADAERRVLTANAAHERMTGFSAQDLKQMRFDETRNLPGGHPLQQTLWATVSEYGHWHGEVQSRRRDGSVYPEMLSISMIRGPDGEVEHYVAVCTDITDTKAGQRHLQYMATHDALTGLVNRAEFERRVGGLIMDAELRHETVAVLFLDLDNFKLVNDSYSHAMGDKLLSMVAERIYQHLPAEAVAGRIGGDEFTVAIGKLKSRDDVIWLARKLITTLSRPLVVDGYDILLGASIGVAAFPLDGHDAGSLITHADAAMYSSKQEERNAFRFYTPRMRADANRRLLLLTDLRRALDENQFQLMYQPSVQLESGRTIGAEALLRWQHPQRGLIMPSEFVPLAETLGLIRHIDEWVLSAACKQLAAWNQAGIPRLRLAINVSASWFAHADFIEQVTKAIRANDLSPNQIMLEITESTILRLGEATRQTMCALHELGVRVAIDDFGTGYSSLSYLKLPAVACLKIDRTFVDGLPQSSEDAGIVQAMLAMARNLGLAAIAEGVETPSQHDFLRRAGCVEGQGYLYARPLSVQDIELVLRDDAQHLATKLKLVPPRS